MRLDPGAGGVSRGRHWMIFDTDTFRAVAAWNASASRSDSETIDIQASAVTIAAHLSLTVSAVVKVFFSRSRRALSMSET